MIHRTKTLAAAKSLLLTLLLFGPMTYTALNRTGNEFLHGWLWTTFIAFILMVVATARDTHPDEDGDTGFMVTHKHAFGSMFIGLLIYAAAATISDLLKVIWLPQISHERTLFAGGFLALAGGAMLFSFRLKYRAVYGLSEATVGVLIAAQKFSDPSGNDAGLSFFIAFLTAGIYLVVRGLDNMHQGLTKQPIDPLAIKVLNGIKARKADE
jgi:hypothetical protein